MLVTLHSCSASQSQRSSHRFKGHQGRGMRKAESTLTRLSTQRHTPTLTHTHTHMWAHARALTRTRAHTQCGRTPKPSLHHDTCQLTQGETKTRQMNLSYNTDSTH